MNLDETKKMIINPYYAIDIAPGLSTPHQPMVSKETWVKGNLNLIKDMGTEAWLNMLLVVLESDYVTESVK